MVEFGKIYRNRPSAFVANTSVVGKGVEQVGRTVSNVATQLIKLDTDSKIIQASNDVNTLGKQFLLDLENTGDYENASERWYQQYKTFEEKTLANTTFSSQEPVKQALEQRNFQYASRVALKQAELFQKNMVAQADQAIDTILMDAQPIPAKLKNDSEEISAYINSIPGLTVDQRSALLNENIQKLNFSALQNFVNTNPQEFLDKEKEFKHLVSPKTLVDFRNRARGIIRQQQYVAGQTQSDAIAALNAIIPDQLTSMAETGEPVDSLLAKKLFDLGEVSKADTLKEQESYALRIFAQKGNLDSLPFDERMAVINRLKPKSGEKLFKSKLDTYNGLVKLQEKEYSTWISDRAAYVAPIADNAAEQAGGNLYAARIDAQIRLGAQPNEIKFFTNNESSLIEENFKNALPEQKPQIIHNVLEGVPEELRKTALSQLNIGAINQFAYLATEGNRYRQNLVFSSINSNIKEGSSQFKEIKADVNDYAESSSNPLSYYRDLALVTGDSNAMTTSTAAQRLMEYTSFYVDQRGSKDPLTEAQTAVFGENIDFVSNDIAIGVNTSTTPVDGNILDILDAQRVYHLGSPPPNYNAGRWKELKRNGSVWVQQDEGFLLYDKLSRTIVVDNNGDKIFVSYEDLLKEDARLQEIKPIKIDEVLSKFEKGMFLGIGKSSKVGTRDTKTSRRSLIKKLF